jgi:L-ribulose-5-phosphate 3-epimerase UlaE
MRIRDGLRDIARGQGAAAAFGAGAVDFEQLFAMLEEQHYAGYFTVDPASSRNVVGEVATALQRLRAI